MREGSSPNFPSFSFSLNRLSTQWRELRGAQAPRKILFCFKSKSLSQTLLLKLEKRYPLCLSPLRLPCSSSFSGIYVFVTDGQSTTYTTEAHLTRATN